ncbi:ribosome biogenesis GTPase Der [Candidatus Haliotispira prima]|uniref:GTPase Der n=1 Tax=Candidatus Haliotispira prima TaxID=3034016 RepID=A0ABY8MLY6_9SPIO|nr:ribosome biogenesis GTPase Der [Candidatus Haliotispira prima]
MTDGYIDEPTAVEPSMPTVPILGHIAVVGRPNVGKSTLFNALLGQRRAITSPESGVTRDVITEQTYFGGFEVLLSDTGGIRADLKDPVQRKARRGQADDTLSYVGQLNERVQRRSLAMLKQADLILWVLALNEFSSEDQQLLDRLQSMRQKVILVINKVDVADKESEAYNFYEYGFPHLVMVSALHRRGLEQLERDSVAFLQRARRESKEAQTDAAVTELEGRTVASDSTIRFTLIGKPNTGKSTLCNTLVEADVALVSDMPGTTRDVLLQRFRWGGKLYELTDTAGIRRKNKVQENVEYYSVNRAIKSLDEVDVAVLMIDSRDGIRQQDKKIAQQIIKRGRGLIFALNKVDLLGSSGATKHAIRDLEEDTRDLFPHLHYAPICSISALSGKNTRQLLNTIGRVHEQLHKRINTGLLNQALQDWMRYYSPPGSGNTRFKARYLTQVEVNPLRFILSVNRSKNFPQSYLNFLQNQIRKELGFMDVPLHLHLHE